MPYWLSVLGAASFTALFGGCVFALSHSPAAAAIAATAVLLNYPADWIVYAQDLTLAGSPQRLGGGL